MKQFFIICISLFSYPIFSQDFTFISNKRLVEPVINGEVKSENEVEIKYNAAKPIGGKRTYAWTINGSTDAKGWSLVKGSSLSNEKIKLTFNKLGNYTVALTIVSVEGENENEFTNEVEDFISVRSLFPELAALYAQKPTPNYVKLVEKASEYVIKPKYVNDPTPNLFLSKGYLGIVKSANPDPRFESAMEECITSFSSAKELDKNGVILDDEHQRFLNELETYLFTENITVFADADPKKNPDGYNQFTEYIDYYSQVTSAPICINFLQGYIKYMKKDLKGASTIWNTEITNLKAYVKLDEETPYGNKYKDQLGNELIISNMDIAVLKLGIMKVSELMKIRDKQNTKEACKLLSAAESFLIDDKEFAAFYQDNFKSCVGE